MLLEMIERGSGGLGYSCACMLYECAPDYDPCTSDCGCKNVVICRCRAGKCGCNTPDCGID